jgi:FkbM family methyltransferase
VLLPYVLACRRLRRDWPSVAELAWSQQRSFSQFGEDLYLLRYFDAQMEGFYVDVGALHPFTFSNTYLLHRCGWRGINIEPAPDGAMAFRRYRPRDVNLQVAVASAEGQVPFRLAGPFAAIDDEHNPSRSMPAERIVVATRTLASVLDQHDPGCPIDLLDVDCEGRDLDVLQSNDWERFRPRLILAEAHDDHGAGLITEFLTSVGYRPLTRLELTFVFEAVVGRE